MKDEVMIVANIFKKHRKRLLPEGAEILSRKRNGKSVKIARWVDGKGITRSADLHEDGQRIIIESDNYYARYVDSNGIERRPSTGCSDKQAAEQVLRTLTARADAIRSGVVTQEQIDAKDYAKYCIARHIDSYINHLEHKTTRGRRTDPTHVANVRRQLGRLVKDCQFRRLSDITKAKVARWMQDRENEDELAGRTINTFRSAVMAFCRWCVLENRLTSNPLNGLYTADETEKKRERRALTEKEVAKLLEITQRRPLINALTITCGPNKGKMIAKIKPERREGLIKLGQERALMFETMIYTGLRLGELAPVKVSDVYLNSQSPYIEVQASDAKDAKCDQVAIPPHLATKLKDWTANKLPTAKLFKVSKGLRKILYRDLALAGIQALDEKGRPIADDQGRKIDVYALRHTCGTQLAKHGVLPQVASKQMRHSSLDITMKHYTHLAIEDKSKAVERLPVYDQGIGLESERKTGTDDCGIIGGVPGGDEIVAKRGVPGGDERQSLGDSHCHKDVTGEKEICRKPALGGSTGGLIDTPCHQKGNCPGLESNQHVPKDTSPSS